MDKPLKNKLLTNIFYYGLGDFLVTGLSAFLLIPIYLSHLTTEEYGIFNILTNSSILFTYIFQFGIISAFSRLIFKYSDDKTNYVNTIILFHFISTILFVFLTYKFSSLIFGTLSPSVTDDNYLSYSVLIGISTFLPNLYYSILRTEQNARLFFWFQVTSASILLSFIFYFIFSKQFNLPELLLSMLFTNGIMLLVSCTVLLPKFKFSFKLSYILETIKLSFPIFITYIAYFIISRYSVVILQEHLSLKEMGVFTFSQQIAMAPTLIAAVIGKAIQPYLFSSKTDLQLASRSTNVSRLYKLFLLWVITSLIYFLEDLFKAILPVSYLSSIPIFQALLAINLLYNFTLVENSILLFKLKGKYILFIILIGSVLNIILNQLLVERFKIDGSLFAMLSAFTVILCLQIYYSRKEIRINNNFRELTICSIMLLLFFGLFYREPIPSLAPFKNAYKIITFFVMGLLLVSAYLKSSKNFNDNET